MPFPSLPTIPSLPILPSIPSQLNIQTLPSPLTPSAVVTAQKILQPVAAVSTIANKASLLSNGIPALLHPPGGSLSTQVFTADDFPAQYETTKAWGIYLAGVIVLEADSVVSFDYKKDWRVSEYPQEQGAFQSYNKVQTPFDVRLRLTKGGTDRERAAFFDALDAAQASLALYDIVTPEKTYSSASIEHVDYRRSAGEGMGLITADVWLKEIRVSATLAFSHTAKAAGADAAHVGTVWAQPTAPSVEKALRDKLTTGSW